MKLKLLDVINITLLLLAAWLLMGCAGQRYHPCLDTDVSKCPDWVKIY